jgi:hypothetical protein
MPVKSSTKAKPASKKAKSDSKVTAKSKGAAKKSSATVKKTVSNKSPKLAKTTVQVSAVKKEVAAKHVAPERAVVPVVVKRRIPTIGERRSKPASRGNQFAFMKAPITEHAFEVGDHVEVFCDHEKVRERVRGWIKGIVVQVDNKMVAVQFRSNVFLTDGWMVPDRILWYPLASEHIRPVGGKKAVAKKDFIPDY